MVSGALLQRSCMAGLSPASALHNSPAVMKSLLPFPTTTSTATTTASSSSSSPSSSFRRVSAMAPSSEDIEQWQPIFKLDQADLLAEAPSLLRCCEGLDWKARASELRALAKSSLPDTSMTRKETQWEREGITESMGNDSSGDTRFVAGLASATAALVQCSFHLSALAAEELVQQESSADAASRAPGWLTPALLAFPVVSYAVFSVYRDQVNPNAKVMDWMFGVAACVIIANLVLIATIGVRLY